VSLISYLTRIHFADQVLDEALRLELSTHAIRRPLIVTDRGIIGSGLIERLYDVLPDEAEAVTFADVPCNPDEFSCRAAAEVFRQHDCDGIIAFGGGSSIDLAKAASLLTTHEGPLSAYAAIEGGVSRIRRDKPPVIAVPTTAGTGSEVGRGALVIVEDGRKLGILSPFLIPVAAICDPTLTLGLPPLLTAGTGMDALTHCIETYISTAYNPPADGIALDGLRRAASNIERAVQNGRDIDARREMMAAAMNGALAFQKGLGGVHAMSHALGSLPGHRLHHGTLNAVLLPHILVFNAPAVAARYAALRQAMRLSPAADLDEAIIRLNAHIGLPSRLSALGVGRQEVEAAAPLAEKDHTNGTNPRRAGRDDYRTLMLDAL
jgi:4-hydroxybutyrate dehydrogenase